MGEWVDGWMVGGWVDGWTDVSAGFGRMELGGSSLPSTQVVSSPWTSEMLSGIIIYQT